MVSYDQMLHINYFKFGLKEEPTKLGSNLPLQIKGDLADFPLFKGIVSQNHPGILVTLGPKSATFPSIQKIGRHTKFFRLNGSHNTIDWHVKVSKLIKKALPEALILLDIPGIKPRTNNAEVIEITKNEPVIFYHGPKVPDNTIKSIELTKPLPEITEGIDSFSLSDGLYEFELLEAKQNYVRGRSKNDFRLLPRKGLNLPGSIYNDEIQLQVYQDFLNKARKVNFDAIGLSFIQNDATLEHIREKFPGKLLVAKIENKLGVENVKKIVDCSDVIMIDRGDLLAEVSIKNFYPSIVKIGMNTTSTKRPLIMATENLESMQYRLQPSKSEIIALQHSINLGSDFLMLSDETATSDLYMNTIDWLNQFLKMQNE